MPQQLNIEGERRYSEGVALNCQRNLCVHGGSRRIESAASSSSATLYSVAKSPNMAKRNYTTNNGEPNKNNSNNKSKIFQQQQQLTKTMEPASTPTLLRSPWHSTRCSNKNKNNHERCNNRMTSNNTSPFFSPKTTPILGLKRTSNQHCPAGTQRQSIEKKNNSCQHHLHLPSLPGFLRSVGVRKSSPNVSEREIVDEEVLRVRLRVLPQRHQPTDLGQQDETGVAHKCKRASIDVSHMLRIECSNPASANNGTTARFAPKWDGRESRNFYPTPPSSTIPSSDSGLRRNRNSVAIASSLAVHAPYCSHAVAMTSFNNSATPPLLLCNGSTPQHLQQPALLATPSFDSMKIPATSSASASPAPSSRLRKMSAILLEGVNSLVSSVGGNDDPGPGAGITVGNSNAFNTGCTLARLREEYLRLGAELDAHKRHFWRLQTGCLQELDQQYAQCKQQFASLEAWHLYGSLKEMIKRCCAQWKLCTIERLPSLASAGSGNSGCAVNRELVKRREEKVLGMNAEQTQRECQQMQECIAECSQSIGFLNDTFERLDHRYAASRGTFPVKRFYLMRCMVREIVHDAALREMMQTRRYRSMQI